MLLVLLVLLLVLCLPLFPCLLQLQLQLVPNVLTGCHSRQSLAATLHSENTKGCILIYFSCLHRARGPDQLLLHMQQ
jgi:hypothetical protein